MNNQIKTSIMKTQNTPVTESTLLQDKPKSNNDKSTPNLWQSVLVGGVPGILIGAIGSNAVEDAIARPDEENEDTEIIEEGAVQEVPEIQVATSVNDGMSFNEAFEAARNEVGPGGAFVWHGHVYGTYRSSDPEWQEMSAEDRAELCQTIMSQVHPAPYTPTEHEPEIVEVQEDAEASSGETAEEVSVETAENQDDEVDVHFIDVVPGQLEDGTSIPVGLAEVNGHSAAFADTDGDGEVDTVRIDLNDNNVLDEGEEGPISGLTVDQMLSEVQANNASLVDDSLYGNMPDYTNDTPDYTNDADTSSFC